MQGFQLTFYTAQNRHHEQRPIHDWLLDEARKLGIKGATIIPASQGYGHDGVLHAAHFFELADQPVQVIMIVQSSEADQLFALLAQHALSLFYVKTPVEFGTTG